MSIFGWLIGKKQRTTTPQHPIEPPKNTRTSPHVELKPLPAGTFRFLALDVETANSNPSSICQIGIAFVQEDGDIATWSTLVNPRSEFAPFNTNIHGISRQHVANAPLIGSVLPVLSSLLTTYTVFQHSTFDSRAIEAASQLAGMPIPNITWADSVRIAQAAWPELRGNGGHGLANLKKHLQLEFNHHDAEHDARACAQIVLLAEGAAGKSFRDLLVQPRSKKSHSRLVAAEVTSEGVLLGEVAVFNGALSIKREEAAKIVGAQGMTVAANVTKKTTLLVVGDQDLAALAGHEKAQSIGKLKN